MNSSANVVRSLVLLALAATVSLSAVGTARAHDPGLSSAQLQFAQDGVIAELSFTPADLQLVCDTQSCLQRLAMNALEVRIDGQPLTLKEASVANEPGGAGVFFRIRFAAREGSRLELRSTLLQSLPRGHKQFVTLRDEHHNILAEQMLENGSDQLIFDGVRLKGTTHSVKKFLLLGIEHILTGYDHLAFLLALLIVGSGLREAAKVISSFTLAHSITLALATFDLIHIPASVVEPLIAVSIIYVGVENLLHQNISRRWRLTFGFGLIHGLGFASVLRDLGIGGTAREAIVPLFSFNLGVELGQIAIALLILPMIWTLRRRSAFKARLAPVCSVVVALMGGYWLIERTLLK
jgi:hydrogenase/urease accessory protein HupE